MTVTELMTQAKESYERPRTPRLCAETSVNDIECNTIESLMIAHDYVESIPDLHAFPCLRKLHISRSISLSEFEHLDLSSIEELYVVFEKKEPIIKINLPKLKKLEVYISNNEDAQLSLFDAFDAVLDIRGCSSLEELHLRHCTGCEIKTDALYTLKKFVCCDYKNYNFDLLNYTPNLVHLVATSCRLSNVDFLSLLPNLVFLDLSFNEITNTEVIFQLSNLRALHIYRNPLVNIEKLKALPFKTFVTEKDRDFLSFVHSIGSSKVSVYSMLKAARKPDPKRKPFLQHLYDKQTDEQIFTRYLASGFKNSIEYHTTPDKTWRKNVLLTKEELEEYVLQEYPFLSEFFKAKTEK